MILSYYDLNTNEQHKVDAIITTDHPDSSYGQPVLINKDTGDVITMLSWILLGYQVEYIADADEHRLMQEWLSWLQFYTENN